MSEKGLKLFEQMIGMLGEAGEGSFWLLLFWIGKGYFVSTLVVGALLILGILIYRVAYANITQHKFIDDVRRNAGVCSFGCITKSERERVMDLVEKGKHYEESK